MTFLLPLTVGVLFATGFYLLLSFHLLRMVFGFLVLSQAANLFLFSVGGLTYGQTPLLGPGSETLVSTEPLSQALILTAIVIGFAASAFLIVLIRLSATALGTVNINEMKEAER